VIPKPEIRIASNFAGQSATEWHAVFYTCSSTNYEYDWLVEHASPA
jgi:hypothetical protein